MQADSGKRFEDYADAVDRELNVHHADDAAPTGRQVKTASSFGEDNTSFLWYPFFPVGDYSVIMSPGGVGKTLFTCGVAAAVSTGKTLPGDAWDKPPQNVLLISGEDSGELLKKRLKLSGADLDRVFILDRSDSIGLNFSDGYDEFAETIKSCNPALVCVDPWQSFIGGSVDVNRINAVRPVLQKLANIARQCQCTLILVSHVNKRAQGDNANNAAVGSSDFINAARSALTIIFDEDDEDGRIVIHTKSNYAKYGQSVKYRITDGGLTWSGFSPITKQTLEMAARKRATPGEIMANTNEREAVNELLIESVKMSTNQYTQMRYSYDDFRREYGDLIFGGQQPKRALDAIRDRLSEDGIFLKTGIQVRKNGKNSNGFLVQRISTVEPEQAEIST